MGKVCTKCKEEKDLDQFSKKAAARDGLRAQCKKCIARYTYEYTEANRAKINEKKRARHHDDKERLNAISREYYRQNKDRYREHRRNHPDLYRKRDKAYATKYPDKMRAKNMQRRVAKLQAMPIWADKEKIEHVYWVCNFISELTGIKHHVDHIHPLRGKDICGLHVHTNLQILTAEENRSKGNAYTLE